MKKLSISVFLFALLMPARALSVECVVLLHGLARTSNSMMPMQNSLYDAGYAVLNISYPSRQKTIEELSVLAMEEGIAGCAAIQASPVSFVTHSLGGILLRYYFSSHSPELRVDFEMDRSVMLGPPNNGSEVVDSFRKVPGFKLINGPAGVQLGTADEDIPNTLGAVDFELGVIAGTKTFNPFLSLFLPKPNDGKVSLESAKVEGMADFIALPVNHSFMMRNDEVIRQVINFLAEGNFQHQGE
jgi:triacylglycerol lipase